MDATWLEEIVSAANPERDKIAKKLNAAIDQMRIDVARVEMWAMALIGFSRPVPDYRPDQHLLPPERVRKQPAHRGK